MKAAINLSLDTKIIHEISERADDRAGPDHRPNVSMIVEELLILGLEADRQAMKESAQ